MSKHKIIFSVELGGGDGDQMALAAIREGMIRNATEDYGIQGYEEGVALGNGGYEGPFIMNIQAIDSDS